MTRRARAMIVLMIVLIGTIFLLLGIILNPWFYVVAVTLHIIAIYCNLETMRKEQNNGIINAGNDDRGNGRE